ncbi:MAG: hypothetical protein V4527_18870 [Pseudomonadota bacterium]
MTAADLTLSAKHGFYLLAPNTEPARAYLAARWSADMGADGVLLPQFFGDAATFASYAVRDGFSCQWGATTYPAGEAGADAMYSDAG